MKFISVCSGIEAASVAWIPLGWECVAVSEIEPFPSAVLAHHYPEVPNLGDMTKITPEQVESLGAELLIGGCPCQAFSVAGLRGGLNDARGNLTISYVQLIRAARILRWAVYENVPGILSDKTNAFGCLLAGLVGTDTPLLPGVGQRWTDAGVVAGPEGTASWRILDSQYFGVAQRRRRVFVLFSRGAGNWGSARALFPLRESMLGNSPPSRETGERPAACLGSSPASSGQSSNVGNGQGNIVAGTVAAKWAKGTGGYAGVNELDNCVPGALQARTGLSISTQDAAAGHLIPATVGAITTKMRDGRPAVDAEHFVPVEKPWPAEIAPTLNAHFGDKQGLEDQNALNGGGLFVPGKPVPIQNATRGKDQNGLGVAEPGDPMYTLDNGSQHAIAFSCKDSGADAGPIAPTIRSLNHVKSHQSGGGNVAVAFAQNSRGELRLEGGDRDRTGALSTGGGKPGQGMPMVAHTLKADGFDASEDGTGRGTPLVPHPLMPEVADPISAHEGSTYTHEGTTFRTHNVVPDEAPKDPKIFQWASGGGDDLKDSAQALRAGAEHSYQVAMQAMRVRRLTPVECERLQAFPDNWTLIPWRKKPAGECPDGPRYRALGNSMTTTVIKYLGERIMAVEEEDKTHE